MAICRSGDVLGYCIEQMVVPMLLEAARLHSPVKVKLQGKKEHMCVRELTEDLHKRPLSRASSAGLLSDDSRASSAGLPSDDSRLSAKTGARRLLPLPGATAPQCMQPFFDWPENSIFRD